MVKIGQIFFITNDLDLYDEESDSRVQCKSLNITEDLGQIEYIFSDKTGTLTENKMVFRRCSIMGTEYPHKENGNPSLYSKRVTSVTLSSNRHIGEINTISVGVIEVKEFCLKSPQLQEL